MTGQVVDGTWAGDWVLDPDRSSVRFRSASLWSVVKVAGRFGNLRGAGSLASDGTAAGTVVIDVSSLDTGNKRRDRHLRSDGFFRAAAHPEIICTVSGIAPDGPGQVRIEGEVHIVDRVHPLQVTATVEEADSTGATLVTDVALDRVAYGIGPTTGMIHNTARVEVRLRFSGPS